MGVIGRFLFWDYPRGSWQYDVMVALIVVFIFVTPRDIFHDQPKAASVVMLRTGTFWIEPALLAGVPESEQPSQAAKLVQMRYKTHTTISSVEPIYDDSEQEVKGYMAFTKP